MIYGKEDKQSGIGLSRDVYAPQFAEPGDIRTNYMLTFHGDVLLESEDTNELAADIGDMIAALQKVRTFLLTKNLPKKRKK